MAHLTIAQYARLKRTTPQAVQGKIKRGKIKLVEVDVKAKRIFVDDTEMENIK